jgi:hypothetical protein
MLLSRVLFSESGGDLVTSDPRCVGDIEKDDDLSAGFAVCTENLIRVDAVMESLSWRNDWTALFRSGRPGLAIQVEVAASG